MSKSTRSHYMTLFQMRNAYLSESVVAPGEQNVAVATLRSGVPLQVAQISLRQKGVS